MLIERIDSSVVYEGPRATLATMTGSPVWGLGDGFAAFAERQGYRVLGIHRPMTPYGLGPQVESYEAPGGARVLRIPSYGMVAGEDWSLRAAEWKVFWILWKAGVQVLLVGGTSGTCDWRDGEEAVRPGDLVLPWTYLSLDAVPSGLPGTELENVLAERVALMDEPFCPALSREITREVAGLETGALPSDPRPGRAASSCTAGSTARASSRPGTRCSCGSTDAASVIAVITGDCVSPVLARVCGMHLGYYHFPSNWAEGLRPQNLTGSLDALYLETLPEVAATLELRLLARLATPTDCRCRQLLRPRPAEYRRALSPPAT